MVYAWYIRPIQFKNSIRNRIGRPIRFEIRFKRKKKIRRSLVILTQSTGFIGHLAYIAVLSAAHHSQWAACYKDSLNLAVDAITTATATTDCRTKNDIELYATDSEIN